MENDSVRYPIGNFDLRANYTDDELRNLIDGIRKSGRKYNHLTAELDAPSLLKTYRPGAWSVAQLVQHAADIQLLHYFRMKKALTEPDYGQASLIDMNAWATLVPPAGSDVPESLNMLDGLNRVYMNLAESLDGSQLSVKYFHPVRKVYFDQRQAIAISYWHLEHHFAHILLALK